MKTSHINHVVKNREMMALAPMLNALRINQTVSFEQSEALFTELHTATGATPPPFELSGNQWCALVNLAIARYALNAISPNSKPSAAL